MAGIQIQAFSCFPPDASVWSLFLGVLVIGPNELKRGYPPMPSSDRRRKRASQKQPTIFQNKKSVLLGETGREKLPRYYENFGLGIKTPKEAIEGTYIDKKCPFTGNVSIQGRILSGVLTKMKMQRTIVIRWDITSETIKFSEKPAFDLSVGMASAFSEVEVTEAFQVFDHTVNPEIVSLTKNNCF
ncbi:40S ribosomal protein S11-like [Rattus rattus]|uniref:40S ribosomal protein S11-like n=1 Tax=Rattus rattus TaxID=10117 RepID=UPI0013F2FE13|nr:40S ribosomal protein S11-like [Rattus rattus]